MSSSETLCNSQQFARIDATADPATASAIRREFSEWLHRHFTLDASKACDVVLAVNEALANAAEYAYATADQPGVMQVQAHYNEDAATLTVSIEDQGAWRNSDPGRRELKRGRGIPLMEALADQAVVDTSPNGTRVRLEWTGVDAAR
jgi:serine/threonine-protein kinase RsbW